MHNRYYILASLLLTALFVFSSRAFAQTPALNTHQGGTGVSDIAAGAIPFGSIYNLRIGTSTNFTFNSSASRLSVSYASTTALSATTLCLTGDTCRTTWPTGGSSSFGTTSISATYPLSWDTSTAILSLLFGTTTQNFWSAYNNFASLFSTAASTTNATTTNLHITGLATPAGTILAVDPNGKVIATTTSAGGVTSVTGTYPVQSTGGATPVLSLAFGTTTKNDWNAHNTFTSLFATNASTTNATTTSLYFTGLTSSGLGVDANGRVYAAPTSTLSNISGTLALTQLAAQAANTVVANGTGGSAAPTALATSSLFTGSNGQTLARVGGTWIGVATTTAGTGLTYNGTSFNVNTSQNIATLSNLTSNGVVYTGGSNGTLNVAASSSIFGFTPASNATTLTINGTANQITSSAGAQDLSANRTWTLSLPSHVIFPTSFQASMATVTNATTTNLHITGLASSGLAVDANGKVYAAATSTLSTISGSLALTQLAAQAANTVIANGTGASAAPTALSTTSLFAAGTAGQVLGFSSSGQIVPMATATCVAITGSAGLCDGNDATGGGGASFGQTWEVNGSGATAYIAPTSTLSIIAAASSTIGAGGAGTGLTINGQATTTGLHLFPGGLIANASSTIRFLDIINSTSTNATTTNFRASGQTSLVNASTTNLTAGTLYLSGTTGQIPYFQSSDGKITATSSILIENKQIQLAPGNDFTQFFRVNTIDYPGLRILAEGPGPNYPYADTILTTAETSFKLVNGAGRSVYIGTDFDTILDTRNSAFALGTSSPYSFVSIHTNNGDTYGTLFAIASSTASATTTLFSISNTGSIFTSLGTGCVSATAGVLSASGSCGGGSFPFSADTNFNQTVYSTSTPTLWFKSGLFASSTSYFNNTIITNATATNATSTNLNVSGQLKWGTGTGLVLTSSGIASNYAGTTCTNQFVRSLDASGAATCATVGSADVSLANLSATDSTLTFSGTYNGSTARTIGINLANANTWSVGQMIIGSSTIGAGGAGTGLTINGQATTTGLHLFPSGLIANASSTIRFLDTINGTTTNSTSTNIRTSNIVVSTLATIARVVVSGIAAAFTPSVEGEIGIDTTSNQVKYFSNSATRVLSPLRDLGFAYATSTWTGTTTLRIGPAPAAITFTYAYCETNTGTVGVSLYDGTNRADYIATASSTINKFNYSATNASFTAGETIRVDAGTPASSPNSLSCRFIYTYDAD